MELQQPLATAKNSEASTILDILAGREDDTEALMFAYARKGEIVGRSGDGGRAKVSTVTVSLG